MGNSTSNAANSNLPHNSSRRTQSPASISSRGGSPVPSANGSHRVHKSLRTKKKSLELPDLASLALTPASSGSPNASPHAAFRRPRASSPIPIPISPRPPPSGYPVQSDIPSAAKLTDLTGKSRYRSYLSSVSAYPSMHSGSPPRTDISNGRHEFVQEVVHSTIPLALMKAEGEGPRPEHVTVTIKWKSGGRSVILARAGDDYWKGRQPMEYDPETKTWSAQIHVLPGTHHFKFLVDDQWLTSSQYPTAVDDLDGSLANYVSVTSPTSTSPSSASPQPTPHPNNINQFASSFWSEASSREGGEGGSKGDAAWTTVIPQELINAAAEEENYLASAGGSPSTSGSVPVPNIPPAPVLPRHLDKLILNVRPQIAGAPGSPGESSRSKKEKEKTRRDRRDREKDSRTKAHTPSQLGMTTNASDVGGEEGKDGNHLSLPVVTPSGTNVTAMYGSSSPSTPAMYGSSSPSTPAIEREDGSLHGKRPSVAVNGNKLVDVLALADDASVLPVPSHVVLHHLSTSAIKNGVLAVANTTRYKKKYITTIYYKPT
ncbi:5'-AMP-activated protein kinase beta subunit, interation domain-containing protein [Irpex lacteus]|nr:5'-AMP-activated protein kinase beta subunit, interation domain-containing protein [Irpex lacteus]